MNINDIANLAGVSRTTVSRYLNHGYVSSEKRERIRLAIEETGYVPSTQAQMLRTKKTKVIGVILPKLNSDAISREMDGISELLSEQGYQLLLASTGNNERKELEYLKVFQQNQVDGIILIATVFTQEHKKRLKELDIPIVILGQLLKGYCCICNDDYNAAKEVTKLLINSGRQNIGYIGVPLKDEAVGNKRYHGYLDAFSESRVRLNERAMVISSFDMQGGYKMAKELLERCPEIDGLFCATDNIAIGAMERIKEMGYKIPKDINIIGFGHTRVSKVVTPKLTTVHFYYKTSGREAASLLLQMIQKEERIVKEVIMGYEIIHQESTK